MKPFTSVMETLQWLSNSGFKGQMSILTNWNPFGAKTFVVKRKVVKRKGGRSWLSQHHNQLFLYES